MDAEGFGATDEDVDSRIEQDFDEAQFDRVRALLEQVETAVPEHSVRRVQVAALILAEGDVGVLEHYVNQARIDFRDVLTPAFYPQQ